MPTSTLDTVSMTVWDLLHAQVAMIDELLARGIVRTRTSPLGDLAETLALRVYGGTLAPNSENSWDLTVSDGRRIQVKP
ncbi:hypothetical protein [Curtobacterium sp. MCBD17_028]|uniref:hypothetical protein n=1 Tax=Curtobacterium sp. MCBD17_028 TaxID=2175670 RepID=UPI000DAA072C|nr:hypothetical protein [Curtobacterium sp. MCBD17_028]PZE24540.1 hypothetical protein DEI86_12225 [Curtobacterium sp. MCBD17_028]